MVLGTYLLLLRKRRQRELALLRIVAVFADQNSICRCVRAINHELELERLAPSAIVKSTGSVPP